MSLYSLAFLLFFAALLVAYYGVGRWLGRGQWCVLLVGSLAFYALAGSFQTLAYLLVTALATWVGPLVLARMDAACKEQCGEIGDRAARRELKARWRFRRRIVLGASLAIPFGALAYLKYWNVMAFQLGVTPTPRSLGLVLPLGISFYTFQSVGYLVDAYDAKLVPERSFVRHLLFVTYFPQLIQGPINRYGSLAPQLFGRQRLRDVAAGRALLLFGYGMLKKFVMADLLLDPIARILASFGEAMPGSLVALAILMYSAQQYGDFSGGIDMVEGVSELMGIEMAPNFRRPYLAVSLADFWRRWHISLGQWMRDYVFYPLALTRPMKALGRRAAARLGRHAGRALPACVANVAVFLLVGVWHGAELHFVVWGLYNGVVIAASDLLKPSFERVSGLLGRTGAPSRATHALAVLRTFLIVNVGWYFDRIEDVTVALSCLGRTLFGFSLGRLPAAVAELGISQADRVQLFLAVCAIVVVLVVSLVEESGIDVRGRLLAWPLPVRTLLYVSLGLVVAASFVFNVGGGFMYANY